MVSKHNSLTVWLGMVPRRLWMAVMVLVILAAFALAFAPSSVVQAGMAGGGSRVIIVLQPDGMAGGGS